MSTRPSGTRPRKEAYYVQIENADKTPMFVNVSNQLGKPLGIAKPLATTMMRVREDAILFSVLKLYKRALAALQSGPLALPPGPLARLERSIKNVTEPLELNQLRVEIARPGKAGEAPAVDVYMLELKRDENGVAALDLPAEAGEATFELPRTPLQMTLYLTSPRTKRLIVVGWQGYQAKPGDPETVVRAAAQALNHISGLAEFQILADIAQVKVPAAPGRYQVITPTRKPSDRVQFTVPVRLWTDDATPGLVTQGQVKVNVDLDNANPTTSQLLFHSDPDSALGEAFAAYRPVFDRALSARFTEFFAADELTDLVCNIALGDISEGDLGRLRDAAATVTGFELSPRQYVSFSPATV